MEYAAINSPEAALVAGLVTSLHCAGMCGPLACVLLPTAGPSADASIIASTYHSTRLASYTLLGALAGGLGRFPLNALPGAILRGIPWLLVVFFVALALRWDRYLPKSLALQRFTWRFVNRLKRRSALASAAGLGLATPLLPCGPLYFLITLSGFTGSALRGAEFMLAFGLGTLPLL